MQKKILLPVFNQLALCLFIVFLSGCETLPGATGSAIPSLSVRPCGEGITLSGRVSLNYIFSHNDKTESLHGKFTWIQNNNKTHINLFSPLGQTMAVIDITPGQAIFTASGKPPVIAADADELVFRQLGWPLPVSGMRNWLQGCATDTNGNPIQADPTHPEITTQNGWQIHYVNWQPFQENQLIPRRIDMTHPPGTGASVSDIRIRLIIDEWHTEN